MNEATWTSKGLAPDNYKSVAISSLVGKQSQNTRILIR